MYITGDKKQQNRGNYIAFIISVLVVAALIISFLLIA